MTRCVHRTWFCLCCLNSVEGSLGLQAHPRMGPLTLPHPAMIPYTETRIEREDRLMMCQATQAVYQNALNSRQQGQNALYERALARGRQGQLWSGLAGRSRRLL